MTIPVVGAAHAPALDRLAAAAGRRRRSSRARPIRKKRCAPASEDVVVVIPDRLRARTSRPSKPAQMRLVADSSSQNARPKVQRVRGAAAALQRRDRQPAADRARHQPDRRHAAADRRRRGVERAAARRADPRLHSAVHHDRGVHRRDADRHRFDRRRARARLDRSAAGQSRAARAPLPPASGWPAR